MTTNKKQRFSGIISQTTGWLVKLFSRKNKVIGKGLHKDAGCPTLWNGLDDKWFSTDGYYLTAQQKREALEIIEKAKNIKEPVFGSPLPHLLHQPVIDPLCLLS